MNVVFNRRHFLLAAGAAAGFPFVEQAIAEQKDERQDGFWWNDQNILERMGFVNGFVTMAAKALVLFPEFLHEAGLRQNTKFAELAKANFDFNDIAYGQYIEGLEKFYKDFRNKRIQVEDAMYYVRDDVRGLDPQKLESQILALRKYAASEQPN